MRSCLLIAFFVIGSVVQAADYPAASEGSCILKDFRFASGEVLPEVRLHYRTIGKAERDKEGIVRNAVLILHGTGGTGGQFVGKGQADAWFAGELFGKGQPLDAERF